MGVATKEWTPTMTDMETVLFDLKGFILFSAVLSEDEIAPIQEQCGKLRTDKESLPPEAGCLPGGSASMLIDHPAIMRVLHTFIDDETEKTRLESAFLSYRFEGDNHRGWTPHAGGKSVNPNYSYQIPRGGDLFGYDTRGLGIERRGERQGGNSVYSGKPQIQFQKKVAPV